MESGKLRMYKNNEVSQGIIHCTLQGKQMRWTQTVLGNEAECEFHALITELKFNRNFLVSVSMDPICKVKGKPVLETGG